MKKSLLALLCLLMLGKAYSQQPITIVVENDLEALIAGFMERGVTVSNITYTGAGDALGSFANGTQAGLGMENGIILSTGKAVIAKGPNNSGSAGFNNGTPGDADLTALSGETTHNASVLEFDLIPEGNVLAFNYVFGSEEYPEYVNQFNDIFGFFLTGPNPSGEYYSRSNIALIPGTDSPVSINTVNCGTSGSGTGSNCELYVHNNLSNAGCQSLQYDGYTVVLPILVNVVPFETYHIKIGIADAVDQAYDSGVFLQSPSLKSYIVTDVETIGIEDKGLVSNNPINNQSTLSFKLATSEPVSVKVFNTNGIEVLTLAVGQFAEGHHSISLKSMSFLPQGVYIIRLITSTGGSNLKVIVNHN